MSSQILLAVAFTIALAAPIAANPYPHLPAEPCVWGGDDVSIELHGRDQQPKSHESGIVRDEDRDHGGSHGNGWYGEGESHRHDRHRDRDRHDGHGDWDHGDDGWSHHGDGGHDGGDCKPVPEPGSLALLAAAAGALILRRRA